MCLRQRIPNAADCPLTRRLRSDLAEGESGLLADDGGGG